MAKTMRLQVTVAPEMYEKLTDYANRMGVTRSSLAAVWLGDAILNHDKAYAIIEDLGNRLGDSLVSDEDTKKYCPRF